MGAVELLTFGDHGAGQVELICQGGGGQTDD